MNILKKSIFVPIIAVTAIAGSSQAQASEKLHHETKIILTIAGIPIGKLIMGVNVANGNYSISGYGKAYGASRLFSNAKGTGYSGGSYHGNTVINTVHKLNYTTRKKKGAVNIKFDNSGVKNIAVSPAIKIKPGTVEVKPSHLKFVQDPVRTTIVAVKPNQVGNGAAICNRTLPVFDGKNRFDLKLRYKGTRKVVTKGFKGLSYVCAVRYVPVAGHRPFKKHIKRMQANKDIEIALARISNSSLYGLIQFKVKTKYGTVVGKPDYYRTVSK